VMASWGVHSMWQRANSPTVYQTTLPRSAGIMF